MLSTTQAAPRGCDSSVPSLPRSARLTAQLQPPFLSCTATSWPGGHKNLHALPPSSGGSAGLASSTAPKHFCSHCGGLCILSCRNPSNTAGRGGGERTNRSRGVLAASAAWFGLVSAAWPLPLPRVLPLGDPPFLLTASPATRPPPLPLLPPPSLLLSLRRVRAHTSGCRPRLQRQTPRRCHLLRQPRPGHSRAPWGCLRPPHSPAWCFGGGQQLRALLLLLAWRSLLCRTLVLCFSSQHPPGAAGCSELSRCLPATRTPPGPGRAGLGAAAAPVFPWKFPDLWHLLPAAPSLAPADPGQRSRALSSQSRARSTEPRRGRGHAA